MSNVLEQVHHRYPPMAVICPKCLFSPWGSCYKCMHCLGTRRAAVPHTELLPVHTNPEDDRHEWP
jgi:hypothetical protein